MIIEERNDITPVCPHCEQALATIQYRCLSAWLGRRYAYFCSHCHKVLGVSHRKGFWMG
jgi:hypothetical protein